MRRSSSASNALRGVRLDLGQSSQRSILVLNADPEAIEPEKSSRSLAVVPKNAAIRNAFTIDVEDWFQVAGFADVITRESWGRLPSRVGRNVLLLLRLLALRQVKATFFISGWIADRYPKLVKEIAAQGHEVASRGYEHMSIGEQGPDRFRESLIRAKAILEDLTGQPVVGYRAPDFSLVRQTPWAHEIIAQTRHQYSSSVFPIVHDRYGMPGSPRFPYAAHDGLLEIPPSTVYAFGKTLPAGGGGFFRLYPYQVSAWAMRRVNSHDCAPVVFYAHPWAVDVRQPRVRQATLASRIRHYANLDRTLLKLDRLLREFQWGSMLDVFGHRLGAEVNLQRILTADTPRRRSADDSRQQEFDEARTAATGIETVGFAGPTP